MLVDKFKKQKLNQQTKPKVFLGGYSLVEMLITLAIISTLLTLVGILLTTLLKTSISTEARTTARKESEYLSAVLRINIANADPEKVLVFSAPNREMNEDGEFINLAGVDITAVSLDGSVANEIHVLPLNGNKWVCIAHAYVDTIEGPRGMLLRTSASLTTIPVDSIDGATHKKCFSPNPNPDLYTYLTYMNSSQINVNVPDINSALQFNAYSSPSGNVYVRTTIGVKPVEWIGGSRGALRPEYIRSSLVKTSLMK